MGTFYLTLRLFTRFHSPPYTPPINLTIERRAVVARRPFRSSLLSVAFSKFPFVFAPYFLSVLSSSFILLSSRLPVLTTKCLQ